MNTRRSTKLRKEDVSNSNSFIPPQPIRRRLGTPDVDMMDADNMDDSDDFDCCDCHGSLRRNLSPFKPKLSAPEILHYTSCLSKLGLLKGDKFFPLETESSSHCHRIDSVSIIMDEHHSSDALFSVLISALMDGDFRLLYILYRWGGVSPNLLDSRRRTVAHYLAEAIVQAYRTGAPVDSQLSLSPSWWAAYEGEYLLHEITLVNCLMLFSAVGIPLNDLCNGGFTPLGILSAAIRNEYSLNRNLSSIIEKFILWGASADNAIQTNGSKYAPIIDRRNTIMHSVMEAAENGHLCNAHFSGSFSRQSDAWWMREQDGMTVLHFASQSGQAESVKLLLHAGLLPHSPSPSGVSPLHFACGYCLKDGSINNETCDFPDVVLLLLDAGACGWCSDCEGNLPLHYACRHGLLKCVEVLLSKVVVPVSLSTDSNFSSPMAIINSLISTRNKNGQSCTDLIPVTMKFAFSKLVAQCAILRLPPISLTSSAAENARLILSNKGFKESDVDKAIETMRCVDVDVLCSWLYANPAISVMVGARSTANVPISTRQSAVTTAMASSDDDDDDENDDDSDCMLDSNLYNDLSDHSIGGYESSGVERVSQSANSSEFSFLSESDVCNIYNSIVDENISRFGLPAAIISAILRYYKWDVTFAVNQYFADPIAVCEKVKIPVYEGNFDPKLDLFSPPATATDVICCICFDVPPEGPTGLVATDCKHYVCLECCVTYLTFKITEGNVARLACPQYMCNHLLPSTLIDRTCSPEIIDKYRKFLASEYISTCSTFKYCPAPGCTYVCDGTRCRRRGIAPVAICSCGYRFCFDCSHEAHAPCTCDMKDKWLKKCVDESETFKFLEAHCQPCPNCKKQTYKDKGCNHMSCTCGHQYCWICLSPWSGHNNYFNCSKYDPASKSDQEAKRSRTQKSLDRYTHYYRNYSIHMNSKELEDKRRGRIEQTIKLMNERGGSSFYLCEKLQEASKLMSVIRQILKWSFVTAFYLGDHESGLDALTGDQRNELDSFEMWQALLSSLCEKLSEKLDLPADKLTIPELADIFSVAKQTFGNVEEQWSFSRGVSDPFRMASQ